MLAELSAHYQHRDRAARAWRARGGQVVGYVGGDTPVELIDAARMLAVRVCGDPRGSTDLAERYLGLTGDAVLRSLLNRLLDGTYDFLDYLVIARDSDTMVLLFQTLRELQRVEQRTDLPPFCLIDVLHLPNRTTQLYDRDELRRLRRILAEWSGNSIDDDDLRAAVSARNVQRALLRQVCAARSTHPPQMSGVEALQIIGAGMVMPVAEHTRLLRGVQPGMARSGRRVFLTGSEHDTADVYVALEANGCVVVGEDHDWASRAFADDVDESADPIDALTDAYQLGAPASARYGIAERAAYTATQAQAVQADIVLAYIRAGDEAPAWDVAHQRAALAVHDIPLVVLADQPYGDIELARLDTLLAVRA